MDVTKAWLSFSAASQVFSDFETKENIMHTFLLGIRFRGHYGMFGVTGQCTGYSRTRGDCTSRKVGGD